MPAPDAPDRQSETWKALSSPSCPPALLPRTAKQRGCGNKTPLFGACFLLEIKLLIWTELLPGLCNQSMGSAPPSNTQGEMVRTSFLYYCDALCSLGTCSNQRHGGRSPCSVCPKPGPVNLAAPKQASPLSLLLMKHSGSTQDLRDSVRSPKCSSASFWKDLAFFQLKTWLLSPVTSGRGLLGLREQEQPSSVHVLF